jgi:hypothetical protein
MNKRHYIIDYYIHKKFDHNNDEMVNFDDFGKRPFHFILKLKNYFQSNQAGPSPHCYNRISLLITVIALYIIIFIKNLTISMIGRSALMALETDF